MKLQSTKIKAPENFTLSSFPANIYLSKLNNKKHCRWRRSGVFIVDFEQVNIFWVIMETWEKVSASTRSIALYILNFFEQIRAGWDPRYETLDVPGDCGFYF